MPLAADRPRPAAAPVAGRPPRAVTRDTQRSPGARPAGGAYAQFAASAARAPDALALIADREHLSYARLAACARALSGRLAELGVGPESVVGICLPRSPALAVSVLAVLRAGGAYLPLDPAYPRERLAFMLEDAAATVLLGYGRVARELAAGRPDLVRVDPRREPSAPLAIGPQAPTCRGNLAYVSYTSGSTGWPKGVAMACGALFDLIAWQVRASRSAAGDRTLQFASLSFDVSFQELFATWADGGTLVLISGDQQRDPAALARLTSSGRVSRLFLPFVALRQLARAAVERGLAPAALREIVTAGEQLRITPEISEWLDRLPAATLENQYGPAETHVVTAHTLAGEPHGWPSLPPIGRAITGSEIHVLSPRLEPVPAGSAGEIAIGGSGPGRGYLGRPGRTARSFVPHVAGFRPGARLYLSGDLGRDLGGGEIDFLGRLDHQLKVRGVRVEPGEVESVLGAEPGVREVVAMAREDAAGERRLIAYLVPETAAARRQLPRWRSALERRLPHFMWPSSYVLLESLPLTASGKVDRRALPAPRPSRSATAREPYKPPRGRLQTRLAEIFGDVLELDRVGAEDDFFRLGGHSLSASRLASRIWRDLGVELPLTAVFERPTIAALATVVGALEGASSAAAPGAGAASPAPALVPVPRRGPPPLSFGQERLWLEHRLEPASAAYNLPMTVRLDGRLDADALARALTEIVRRHEVLRTLFRDTGGRGAQVIRTAGPPPPLIDLLRLAHAAPDAARRIGAADARRPFDLAAEPPLRAALVRAGRRRHLLLLTFHHIASDGWSDAVFFRELGALYDAFSGGRPSPLPVLPIQVADVAIWQRRWLTGDALEARLSYWRRQLGPPREPLDLAGDRPRAPVRGDRGGRRRFAFTGQARAALEDLGRRTGSTLFMVLLAGYQALLHRLTGQDRIAVGTPVAARGRPETEGLIGFFVNTLVLRVDCTGDPAAAALLGRVREVTLGAQAHQDLPFDRLVRELEPERDPGRTPLFQTMVVMQQPLDPIRLRGLESRFEMRDNGASMFDLTLYLTPVEEGLEGTMEYAAERFDATTVDRLCAQLRTLLAGWVATPEAPVSALPLLTEPERQALLAEAADTIDSSPPESLHRLFQRQGAATPEATALVDGDRHLSYRRLDARARRLARRLLSLGAGPETVVGVCLERGLATVEAVLATLEAGAAYLPLDPAYPRRRLVRTLEDARAAVLIGRRPLAADLVAGLTPAPRLIDVDQRPVRVVRNHATASPGLTPRAECARAAYLIYTSGSRGAPKGVVGRDLATVNRCRWMWRRVPFAAGEVCCQKTTLSFVDSVWEIFGPLLAGVPSVLVPEDAVSDPRRLVTILAARRVSRIVVVPSLLRLLLDAFADLERRLPELRLWVVSGETLPAELARRFAAELPRARLLNLYGSSEVAADVTCFDARRWASERPVPIGRPIANTRIHVTDRRLRPLPFGAPGELAAGGAGLARGYLRRPRMTAAKFVPDPWSRRPGDRLYRTGDRGRRLAGGQLDFLGRLDDQVKIRGFRIESGEIETALRRHPAVRQAACVASAETSGDRRLVAYVEPRDAAPGAGELRAFLVERLPAHMVPSLFVTLDALPLAANGKLDRRALPPARPVAVAESGSPPPRTALEEILAAVWARVLELPRVGTGDNFFRLGGHSLLATRVSSRLRQALGLEVAPRRLFEYPTVARLAAWITARSGAGPRLPAPRRIDHGDQPPLSFAQERLWFLEQLTATGAAYNLPEAWDLEGELDVAALAAALTEICRRHRILRCRLRDALGRPVQILAGHRRRRLPVVDLGGLGRRRRSAALRLSSQEARRRFDLERHPPLRATLLRLAPRRHRLLLTLHHGVADGWSRNVLRRELGALYRAARHGQAAPLAEPPIQYADFAAWQRRCLAGEVMRRQLSDWRRRLGGLAPLRLPLDRRRPVRRGHRGGRRQLAVEPRLAERLRQLGADHGASPYMTLLAAFLALLCRLSGQRDLAVGSLVANRGHRLFEGLIGLFVNSLVLRVDASGDPPFVEWLRRVREVVLEASARQDLPFEKLVAELAPERDLARNPLFQVVCVLHEAPAAVELEGLATAPVEVDTGAARFDLSVHLWPSGDGLEGLVTYDAELFDATTVERLARSYTELLAAVVADPKRPIDGLARLPRAARHQLAVEWNDRRRPAPPATAYELFAARAAATPEAPALVWGDGALSYGELARRAGMLAGRLRASGVGPERVVGLRLGRGPELVIAILATWRAGGACLPLDPGLPAERLALMAEDAGAVCQLTGEGLAVPSPPAARSPDPAAALDLGHLAYVFYTSGSTGRPKGVTVSHRSLANRLRWGQETYPLGAGDAVLQLAETSFDFSLWEIAAPLAAGAKVVFPERAASDLEALTSTLRRQRVSVAHFVPSLLAAWLEVEGAGACDALTRVFSGGEPLPSALFERFAGRLAARLDHQYGPTEATIDVSYQRARPPRRWRHLATVPIGRPIGGTDLHLLDSRLTPVPLGAAGELAIGGAGLARGYAGRPGLTAAAFVPHPLSLEPGRRLYSSGDLARQLAGGAFEHLGRLDRQVQLRGVRVELGEIEQLLLEQPAVRSAAALVERSAVVAFVVPRRIAGGPGAASSAGELRRALGLRLPAIMVPSRVVRLERLPRTPAGKVDRLALARVAAADTVGERDFVAPRTPIEALLAEIWARVLAVPEVGAHDDFFRLGGHSLIATRVISRIRGALGLEVPVRALFERRTVAELARSLERAPAAAAPPAAAARPRRPPLSFAQERLWFLDRLEGPSAAYNVPAAVELDGDLDAGALARAFKRLIARHEVLRTRFETAGGRAWQAIQPPPAKVLAEIDLRALGAAGDGVARRLACEEAARPFDLARGPLLRARLLRVTGGAGKRRYRLLLTLHHIATDAWSSDVLRRELAAHYRACRAGEPSPLPALAVQVADVALWQRRRLAGARQAEELGYWRRQLAGLPELRLPTDRPRPAEQTFRGAARRLSLSAADTAALQELSARSGASLFMTVHAGFCALLGRASGQRDFAVGSPIANRGARELEELIGLLVNTQALRADLSPAAGGREPSFAQLLERMRETALDAYAHQELPFEEMVEALAPARDLGRHPLFQVLCTLREAPRPAVELPGVACRELEPEGLAVRFDQEWHLWYAPDGGLEGRAIYNLDLFDAATVERWARQLRRLLAAAAATPELGLDRLPLWSPAERHQLEIEWSSGGSPAPATGCLELFARQAARAPDSVALVWGEEQLSYRRLARRIVALARRLRRLGVGPEVTVALEIERSPSLVIAALAVLSAGGAYLPVDPAWPRRRRRWIKSDARPALTLTAAGDLPAAPGSVVSSASAAEASPESPAYMIYTSGSTGQPKGVCMRRGALDALIRWQLQGPGFAAGRRVLQFASFSFDVSFQETLSTLASGGALVLLSERRRRDAEAWSRLAERARVERLFLPVVALEQLAEVSTRRSRPLPALKEVIVAGEQLRVTPAVRSFFERLDRATLANHYGPSETHVVSALVLGGSPGRWPARPAIGRPIAGARLCLRDRRLRPVPAGTTAEICAGGAAPARGYLRRPAWTAARFVPDAGAGAPGRRLYLSGDLGRHRSGGVIEFLRRADGQLKIRGFRIEPGEIEAALERHPEIRRAVVAAFAPAGDAGEAALGGRRLAAYLLARGRRLDERALRAWLRRRLAEPMIPSRFMILDRLPLTATGKIDRGALPPPPPRVVALPPAAPRDEIEGALAEIFARLLDCGPVAPGDDFFALGGHSLLAVRLVEQVERRLGARLPLAAVFRGPALEELAAVVRAAPAAPGTGYDRVAAGPGQRRTLP